MLCRLLLIYQNRRTVTAPASGMSKTPGIIVGQLTLLIIEQVEYIGAYL